MAETDSADVLRELAKLPELAHPTVSPNGGRVAFYYNVTGRNELHVLDVESGEREQWSNGEVPRSARWPIAWDAEGTGSSSTATRAGTSRTTSTRSTAREPSRRSSRWMVRYPSATSVPTAKPSCSGRPAMVK